MARSFIILALVAACGSDSKQAPSPVAPVDVTAETQTATDTFRVDVTPPATCARGTTCEAKIALTALAGFKVNAEYPFKFVGDVGPQLSFEGTGTFAPGDKQNATMTIKFRSEQAGTVKVSGTFKLSVCTDDVCKIEQPKIAFDVPVT